VLIAGMEISIYISACTNAIWGQIGESNTVVVHYWGGFLVKRSMFGAALHESVVLLKYVSEG
jgi:hypothetical protein